MVSYRWMFGLSGTVPESASFDLRLIAAEARGHCSSGRNGGRRGGTCLS
jgi:hypothetical protein